MFEQKLDFYSPISSKLYNLDQVTRDQLNILGQLDHLTRQHCENVANLCFRICEYLKCTQSFTIYCTVCGYLHDIGKMYIPREILTKPTSLTDEEFEIVKTHTTKGYEICMKDINLRPYAKAVLDHHEALNGTGYPNGITKKDIPYEAQIIRVADEYDAIVTKRQYQTHINISETLKELIKDTKPDPKFLALDNLATKEKDGKVNGFILQRLFKVVIDDILYEITGIMNYVEYLKNEIKRLEQAEKYEQKGNSATKEKNKNYYYEGVKYLLKDQETMENYKQILNEYRNTLAIKEDMVDKLYQEIKIIKKLRV